MNAYEYIFREYLSWKIDFNMTNDYAMPKLMLE